MLSALACLVFLTTIECPPGEPSSYYVVHSYTDTEYNPATTPDNSAQTSSSTFHEWLAAPFVSRSATFGVSGVSNVTGYLTANLIPQDESYEITEGMASRTFFWYWCEGGLGPPFSYSLIAEGSGTSRVEGEIEKTGIFDPLCEASTTARGRLSARSSAFGVAPDGDTDLYGLAMLQASGTLALSVGSEGFGLSYSTASKSYDVETYFDDSVDYVVLYNDSTSNSGTIGFNASSFISCKASSRVRRETTGFSQVVGNFYSQNSGYIAILPYNIAVY